MRTVPQTRFNRELNKWLRHVEATNEDVAITRCGKVMFYLLSIATYEKYTGVIYALTNR